MVQVGKNRCGCDCKNQTESVEQGTTGTGTEGNPAPCCDAWPNGTPCRYAILFECFHDWPLWTDDPGCGRRPFGVTLNWDGADYCGIPSPLGLTFPVMEVLRECLPDITGECIFTNKLYNNNQLAGTTHMAPSYLENLVSGAVNPAFPPYRENGTDGGLEYVYARYGRTVPIPGYGADTEWSGADRPDCIHQEEGTTLWELKIGSDPATLEWVYDYVLNNIPAFSGNTTGTGTGTGEQNTSRPRYVADAAWNLWGRNTMTLQNPAEWPGLRRKICVVALPQSYVPDPCTSHTTQCTCCDTGYETLPFSVNITNCSRLSGTYAWDLTRNYGAPPYCGVSNPSAPCGWFWATIGTSGDCPVGGTPEYSGEVGFLIYCDGSASGTADSPYNIDIYCYRNDTACWESAGSANITSYECRCDGPFFTFSLGGVSCCCDEEPPPDCTCTPPSTLYLDMSGCLGWEASGAVLTESGGVWSVFNPATLVDIFELRCIDGQWTARIQPTAAECLVDDTVAVSGTCEPFFLTFSLNITGDCCGGGATTITFTISE